MKTIHGIPVFPGVAIGPALVFDRQGDRIPRAKIRPGQVDAEIARFEHCIAELAAEFDQSQQAIREKLGAEVALIFEAHKRMATDPHLRDAVVKRIQTKHYSPEFAVKEVLGEYLAVFRKIDSHFADRANDIQDIQRQILRRLTGDRQTMLDNLTAPVVVLAVDLTPSETASFDPERVLAIVTETGGLTSHTAIVAGALEIPAVVGVGNHLSTVGEGETVIVDGNHGLIILDADLKTIEKYQDEGQTFRKFEADLQAELRDEPAITKDGVRIQLLGNIEFDHEAATALKKGADGIGLYRTEFLYLDRDHSPTEEEHYQAYASVVQTMGPDRPVVFRTMDLGADKFSPAMRESLEHRPEHNPVLGLRSVRLSLRHLELFKTQLRAMLRASVLGDVRIMFPLISTVQELRRCRMIINDVMEDMTEEGASFRREIPIGMMVEVPSAALLAKQFAKEVSFFSIGTNDLTQYTLAADRTNETVAGLYNAADPAVLTLVRQVIAASLDPGLHRSVQLNVCGEVSGDPAFTLLLIGMGIRSLSITPHKIPEIKKVIRSIDVHGARRVADQVEQMDTASNIVRFLQNEARKLVPEHYDEWN